VALSGGGAVSERHGAAVLRALGAVELTVRRRTALVLFHDGTSLDASIVLHMAMHCGAAFGFLHHVARLDARSVLTVAMANAVALRGVEQAAIFHTRLLVYMALLGTSTFPCGQLAAVLRAD
jgi:hypothetical protein